MSTEVLAIVLGQLLTFLSVIAGFISQHVRETRQHRWADQRRQEMGRELTLHIEENTEISREAFREANDVNMKIHALGLDARLRKDNYVVANDGA